MDHKMTITGIDKLSAEEINARIAVLCNYEFKYAYGGVVKQWYRPGGNRTCDGYPPDFHGSMDAMALAEQILPSFDKTSSSNPEDYATLRYTHELSRIVGVKLREETVWTGNMLPDGKPMLLTTFVHASDFETFKIIQATATQRAKAFLAVIGMNDQDTEEKP